MLFAFIPPTFAAEFTITSGLNELIKDWVSSKENKSASFLVEAKTSWTFCDLPRTLSREDPTKPFPPSIKTFIQNPI